MALIKCPECNNKISDKAEVCPKCGYELNKNANNLGNNNNNTNNNGSRFTGKFKKDSYRYLFIFAVVIILFLIYTQNKGTTNNNKTNNPNTQGTTEPAKTSGYMTYTDSKLGISFEYPSSYKVATDKDGFIYVAKNIDNEGALIPYIIVGRYTDYTNEVQFLNAFTDYMRKIYSDLIISIDLVSGQIGGKTVYGLAYNYTSSGHLIVDNRYATIMNNNVYMIASKEENTNSSEINSVVEHIISTLSQGR